MCQGNSALLNAKTCCQIGGLQHATGDDVEIIRDHQSPPFHCQTGRGELLEFLFGCATSITLDAFKRLVQFLFIHFLNGFLDFLGVFLRNCVEVFVRTSFPWPYRIGDTFRLRVKALPFRPLWKPPLTLQCLDKNFCGLISGLLPSFTRWVPSPLWD